MFTSIQIYKEIIFSGSAEAVLGFEVRRSASKEREEGSSKEVSR
jgi:hypothetical protein